MSSNEIATKAREIKELTRMKEEIEAEINSLQDDIKSHMTAINETEITAGIFKIRWIFASSSRVDSASLKKDLPDVAARYSKVTESRRFTIN